MQAHALPLSGDAGSSRGSPAPGRNCSSAVPRSAPRSRIQAALSPPLAAATGIAEPRRRAASLSVGLAPSPRVACRSRSARPAAREGSRIPLRQRGAGRRRESASEGSALQLGSPRAPPPARPSASLLLPPCRRPRTRRLPHPHLSRPPLSGSPLAVWRPPPVPDALLARAGDAAAAAAAAEGETLGGSR